MLKFSYLTVALTLMAAIADAQELSPKDFDAHGYVARLNAASAVYVKGELTNADTMMVAQIGCETVRKVQSDELFDKAAYWIENAGYPDPEAVEQVGIEQFLAFEIDAFREVGASEATVAVLERRIRELEVLPVEPPSFDVEMLSGAFETRYCDDTQFGSMNPDAVAGDAQLLLASSVMDTVLGAATVTVDAAISVGSSGLDSGLIAIISGGLGYDLIKRGLGG